MSNRATALLSAIREVPGCRIPDAELDRVSEMLRDALREQDRVTRLSCAVAVLACEDQNELCADTDAVWIDAEDASAACMNVRDGDLYHDQP